jgi:hypothetical protein
MRRGLMNDVSCRVLVWCRCWSLAKQTGLTGCSTGRTWSLSPRGPPVLAGADQRAFIDIDSLLRPVYGYAKQGCELRAHQSLGQAGPAQRPLAAGHHDQHPDRRAGGGRDPAAPCFFLK